MLISKNCRVWCGRMSPRSAFHARRTWS